MDTISKAKRSWNMGRIRSENTRPEKVIRSILYHLGYRFRLHCKDLPGKPDIVVRKYKIAIEVRGCFWHRHKRCKKAYMPKTNKKFRQKKFSKNTARDLKNKKELKAGGWNLLVIWECELQKKKNIEKWLSEKIEKIKQSVLQRS